MNPDDLDRGKLAEAVLAILSLTMHDDGRVWKAIDFDLMNQLYEKGWFSDPKNKAKSVFLTDEGMELAETYLARHFGRQAGAGGKKTSRTRTARQTEIVDAGWAHILCCTAKLLKEIRMDPLQAVTDQVDYFHVWYANLLRIDRRKCVLFVNAQTLYSFVVPGLKKSDFENIGQVFIDNLIINLMAEDIGGIYLEKLKATTPEVAIAKTQNRSVLGSMNDLAYHVQVAIDHRGGLSDCDPIWLNNQLNRIPMGALDYVYGIESIKQVLDGG